LRSQILVLLKKFAPGPKPVRVQLCVCLAILAIQMQTWKDVLPTVVSALGNDVASHACILDFLRVLPEEVTEGRKITLSVCGSICRDFVSASTSAFRIPFLVGSTRDQYLIRS
jgi:Exportin 1-like protein